MSLKHTKLEFMTKLLSIFSYSTYLATFLPVYPAVTTAADAVVVLSRPSVRQYSLPCVSIYLFPSVYLSVCLSAAATILSKLLGKSDSKLVHVLRFAFS